MPSTGLPWEITLAGIGGGSCLLMEPHGVSSRPARLSLQGEDVSAPISSAGFLDRDGAMPAQRFEFQYVTETRDATAFLRDYFDARRGMAEPFWFPMWQKELNVADYYDTGDLFGHIWLRSEGYAETIWPLGPAYRRVVMTYGNDWLASRVSQVALNAPEPGLEELVRAESNGPLSAFEFRPHTERRGFYFLSLRFGRFDSDMLTMDSLGDGRAVITLPIVELPDEAIEGA